jgi:uncharacterized protein
VTKRILLQGSDIRICRGGLVPFRGHEIPSWKALGLGEDRVYRLLRRPETMEAVAATVESMPFVWTHVDLASDWTADFTAGRFFSARYRHPYLVADVDIWDAETCADIADGRRQLSIGGFYQFDMVPGVYEGTPFDGTIRNFRIAHVALVKEGRCGPEVGLPKMYRRITQQEALP